MQNSISYPQSWCYFHQMNHTIELMLMRRLGLLTPSTPPATQWSVASDDDDGDKDNNNNIPPLLAPSHAADHPFHLPSFLMGMALVASGVAIFILGTYYNFFFSQKEYKTRIKANV